MFRLKLICANVLLILISYNPAYPISFSAHTIAEDIGGFSWIEIVDLDTDGDLDIISVTSRNRQDELGGISWWENNGNAEFEEHVIMEDVETGNGLCTNDIDQDGDIDVIATISDHHNRDWNDDLEPGSIIWFENNGEEHFEEQIITDNFFGANRVAAGDVDEDGDIDVLGSSYYWDPMGNLYGAVVMWENQGDGGFVEQEIMQVERDRGFLEISIVDFDQDDDPDIVTGTMWDGRIRWFENNGEGAFVSRQLQPEPDYFQIRMITSIDVVDLDRDDDFDVLATSWSQGTVAWLENEGEFEFAFHFVHRNHGDMRSIHSDDINGDELPDILCVDADAGVIHWWANDENNEFELHQVIEDIPRAYIVNSGDMDGDGDIDVVGGFAYGVLAWFEQVPDDAPLDTIVVTLAPNWSLISSHVDPAQPDIPDLFAELNNRGTLLFVKDGQGHFYSPAFDYNDIPFWNFREGYLVKVAETDDLTIIGEPVASDTPIPLQEGWNTIAYFPEEEVEVPDAFANIAEFLLIAKDGDGNFYVPNQGYNSIPPLHRGTGYQVKVSDDTELIWFVP